MPFENYQENLLEIIKKINNLSKEDEDCLNIFIEMKILDIISHLLKQMITLKIKNKEFLLCLENISNITINITAISDTETINMVKSEAFSLLLTIFINNYPQLSYETIENVKKI